MRAGRLLVMLALAATACQADQPPPSAPSGQIRPAPLPSKVPAWRGQELVELKSPLRGMVLAPTSRLVLFCGSGVFESPNAGRGAEFTDRHLTANPGLVAVGSGGAIALGETDRVLVHRPDADTIELGVAARPELLVFDDAARQLAVISGGACSIFDLGTGQVARQLELLDPEVAAVPGADPVRLVRSRGFRVLRLTGGRRIRVVDLDEPSRSADFHVTFDDKVLPSVSADGASIAYLNGGGGVEIRHTDENRAGVVIDGSRKPVTAISMSPDSSVVAVAGDGAVELWDVTGNLRLARFESDADATFGVRFGESGGLLAWLRRGEPLVQVWRPLGRIVDFGSEPPRVDERAAAACHDLAELIRYRTAGDLFVQASDHIAKSQLDQAKTLLDESRRTFAGYPGLAAAYQEVERLRRAMDGVRELEARVVALEQQCDFTGALELVDEHLGRVEEFGGFGLPARKERLRKVLALLQQSEAHRGRGEEIDTLLAFEQAAGLYPVLASRHPEYGTMRKRLESQATNDGALSFQSQDWAQVISAFEKLDRLGALSTGQRLQLARAHQSLGDNGKARAAYQAVEPDSPSYAAARIELAEIARSEKDYPLALAELHRAGQKRKPTAATERMAAELHELAGEDDNAVAAWRRVHRLDPDSTRPLRAIAAIEGRRGRHEEVARVLEEAAGASGRPTAAQLLELAEAWRRCKNPGKAVAMYSKLLDRVERGQIPEDQIPGDRIPEALGDRPRARILTEIHELGFMSRHGTWVERERFMRDQGWTLVGDEWLRPEQEQLRSFAARHQKDESRQELRSLSDEEYAREAAERRVALGMRRREVIRAWGYFEDQHTLRVGEDLRYDQLLFGNGRRVYLRNGLLCAWSE